MWPCVSQIFSTVTPACLIASRIFGTSPPGSITTAFLLGSSHRIVQFCSNSVTGTIIAPAFAWVPASSAVVSVWFAIAAHCRFLLVRQVKDSCGEGRKNLQRSILWRITHRLRRSAGGETLQRQHLTHP